MPVTAFPCPLGKAMTRMVVEPAVVLEGSFQTSIRPKFVTAAHKKPPPSCSAVTWEPACLPMHRRIGGAWDIPAQAQQTLHQT